MSFLHFFAVFYKKYSDLLQVVLQCKKYSESTAEDGTQRKTVIFTADIFAVYSICPTYMEHPIMAFECKQINFWTSFSSINLFSTTMCTIPVKKWPHLDHWSLN